MQERSVDAPANRHPDAYSFDFLCRPPLSRPIPAAACHPLDSENSNLALERVANVKSSSTRRRASTSIIDRRINQRSSDRSRIDWFTELQVVELAKVWFGFRTSFVLVLSISWGTCEFSAQNARTLSHSIRTWFQRPWKISYLRILFRYYHRHCIVFSIPREGLPISLMVKCLL